MADRLRVDLVALQAGSDHIAAGVDEAAVSFTAHEADLAAAAPGWVGASQQALAEVAARWEGRHLHHKVRVAGLHRGVIQAGIDYSNNENSSASALESLVAPES